MANSSLSAAKTTKNDEFYTQYADIQKEVNAYIEYDKNVFRDKTVLLPCDDPEQSNFTKFFAQNFERYGLKRLISTSYARSSKKSKYGIDTYPSLFEEESPIYDADKSKSHGRIFILDRTDVTGDGRVDYDDLTWEYLDGDGDFRSDEVKLLRDDADVIVTNPPFSMFREFLAWIVEADKKFLVIGNMNAITYKEVFPLIKENKIWLGATGFTNDMVFAVPEGTDIVESDRAKAAKLGYVGNFTRLGNSCWFTNLDHGRRHQPLSLMTMADNLKFSRHKEIRGKEAYTTMTIMMRLKCRTLMRFQATTLSVLVSPSVSLTNIAHSSTRLSVRQRVRGKDFQPDYGIRIVVYHKRPLMVIRFISDCLSRN